MQSISVFLDITKVADFRLKNTNVNRTQGVCDVIYISFESSLGNTQEELSTINFDLENYSELEKDVHERKLVED